MELSLQHVFWCVSNVTHNILDIVSFWLNIHSVSETGFVSLQVKAFSWTCYMTLTSMPGLVLL
jgi:hypothetical protein